MLNQTDVAHRDGKPAPAPKPTPHPHPTPPPGPSNSDLSQAELLALIGLSLSALNLLTSLLEKSKEKNTADQIKSQQDIAKTLDQDIANLVKLLKQESEAEATVSSESGFTKFLHKIANAFGDHYTTEADVDALKAKVEAAVNKLAGDLTTAFMELDPKLTKQQAKKLAQDVLKLLGDLATLGLGAKANGQTNAPKLTKQQAAKLVDDLLKVLGDLATTLSGATKDIDKKDPSKNSDKPKIVPIDFLAAGYRQNSLQMLG